MGEILLIDEPTWDALIAFFGRVGLEDLKGVLRRVWRDEAFDEEQISELSSNLVLFYYHSLWPRERDNAACAVPLGEEEEFSPIC